MLAQRDVILQLKILGLNSYESRLWTALLAKGAATAGELSDMANVPRSRTYDVLESLEKKGFIIMKIGKPIKYVAISPESVLERVKKKISEEAVEKTNSLEKLKGTDIIVQLLSLYKSGLDIVEPFELSGSIKGRKNIYNHLETMIKDASKTVSLTTTADGLLRKKEALTRVMKKARDRGVKIRISAPINDIGPELKKEINMLKDIADLKHSDAGARFCVVDSSQVLFMITDDTSINSMYDSAIWINAPFLASVFEKMFESGKNR